MKESYREEISQYKRLIRKLRILEEGKNNEKTINRKVDSNKR